MIKAVILIWMEPSSIPSPTSPPPPTTPSKPWAFPTTSPETKSNSALEAASTTTSQNHRSCQRLPGSGPHRPLRNHPRFPLCRHRRRNPEMPRHLLRPLSKKPQKNQPLRRHPRAPQKLREKGIKTAVASNKDEAPVKKLTEMYLKGLLTSSKETNRISTENPLQT